MEANRAALTLPRAFGSRALAGARRIAASTWALGGLVCVLTWGGGMLAPYTPSALDPSLHAALNLAIVERLDWGSDLVFTYGPLGFLKSYMLFYEWPARLAALYGIAMHLALSVTLVWAIRRTYGVLIAVILALVIASLARGDALSVSTRADATMLIIAFTWCVIALSRDAPAWTRPLVLYGGGAFAAIEILAKLNTGAIVLAFAVLAAVAIEGDWRRNLAALLGTFAATLVTLWFASGQGLDNVWPFISGSLEVISGYSTGARLEWSYHMYEYALAPGLIAVAGVLTWVLGRGLEWRRRAAILLAFAILAFTQWKNGFVSHDIFHMATFYAIFAAVFVVLPLPPLRWARIAALAAAAGTIWAAAGTSFSQPWAYPMTDPLENLRNGGETVATLLDEDRLDARIAENRAHLKASYGVTPAALAELEGHTVHVDPSEISAVWAYELEWRPLPIFQPYVAWTEGLDRRNAETLADPDGPERILRQNFDALGRYPAYESPAAMIAMLCHFEPLHTTEQWQVLGRVPDRCGEPRPIGNHTTTYGEPIEIPEAPRGHVVFARAEGLDVSGIERLRTMLFRSQGRQVVFEGDPFIYNFLPGTSGDGLLLAGDPRVDYQQPYRLTPEGGEVTFLLQGDRAEREISLEWYAMPVRPW